MQSVITTHFIFFLRAGWHEGAVKVMRIQVFSAVAF
jgi:hypothetical protein